MRRFANFPPRPESYPFFYGWLVVVVGTLGIVGSIPGQTMGVSVFTPRLMEALRLSSPQLSLAYGLGTVMSGLLLVRGGRLVDRFGVRVMMVMSSAGLALGLLLLAVSGDIADTLASPLSEAGHVIVAMGVAVSGFFLIRFLGQGMMAMISRVMVGKWFNRRRGLAIGLSGVLTAFGFGYAPLFMHNLIEAYGWRGAYGILAALVGGGMGVVAWLFYREQPEDHGLVKDGGIPPDNEEDHEAGAPEPRDFTLAEARRNYEFWLYTLGLGMQGLIVTAITFHIVSLGAESGLSEARTVSIFLPIAGISVVSNFLGGWISDKTRLKYLLIVELLALAAGTAAFIMFSEAWGRAVVIVGFGISAGLFGCLVGVTWPRFFGLRHLGSISGQNMSIMVLLTALGPLLYAVSRDLAGSYTPGIVITVVLPLLLAVAALPSGNPQDGAH